MTPIKALKDYLRDIENQQWVALNAPNLEDATEIELISKEFKSAIKLIEYWTK